MPVILDCEIYSNFFLCCVKVHETGYRHKFCWSADETFKRNDLALMMATELTVGFNSFQFDLPLIAAVLRGYSLPELHEIAQKLIFTHPKDVAKEYKLDWSSWNHIDLIEPCPLSGSLKLYAARLHCPQMKEVNFPVQEPLTQENAIALETYCWNDVENTDLVYTELLPHLELLTNMSNTYKVDLRSKSDAQLAQIVIVSEVQKLSGRWSKKPTYEPGFTFKFRVPSWCSQFQTPHLRRVVELIANAEVVLSDALRPECGAIKSISVNHGVMRYQMGLGGMHSTETSVTHRTDFKYLLVDRDVKSYYPTIILAQELFPKTMGRAFLKVFAELVRVRLLSVGHERDARKIVINGTFGKQGDPYSPLFSPENLTQVTLTGQLGILLLIEMIEAAGAEVISGNTDGTLIKCPVAAYPALLTAIEDWEHLTTFETEETRYSAVFAKDVNNYLALQESGKWKLKGVYAKVGSARNSPLAKNPDCYILSLAAQAFLKDGTPVEETVEKAEDIRDFLKVQNLKAPGAHKSGTWLGKSIRFYYSTRAYGTIQRVSSNHNVDDTEGAMPCMTLPTKIPQDLNRDWYIQRAKQILRDVGAVGQPRLF